MNTCPLSHNMMESNYYGQEAKKFPKDCNRHLMQRNEYIQIVMKHHLNISYSKAVLMAARNLCIGAITRHWQLELSHLCTKAKQDISDTKFVRCGLQYSRKRWLSTMVKQKDCRSQTIQVICLLYFPWWHNWASESLHKLWQCNSPVQFTSNSFPLFRRYIKSYSMHNAQWAQSAMEKETFMYNATWVSNFFHVCFISEVHVSCLAIFNLQHHT